MPLFNSPPSCQTVSGIYIEPCSPRPEDILITDIAHCLSLANRWAGNTQYIGTGYTIEIEIDGQKLTVPVSDPFSYSVAQHSCHVHDIVVKLFGSEAAFYALMHDASEAYLMDVPRPIKPLLTNYYEIEGHLMKMIIDKFGVPYCPEIKKQVVEIDNAMIFWERDAIVGQPIAPFENEDQHPGGVITDHIPLFCSWSPKRAKAEFMMRFKYHEQMHIMLGDDGFDRGLKMFTHDNLNSPMAGMAVIDYREAA